MDSTLLRAFSVACSAIATGCIVGGSVVFFTVHYHNRVLECEPPAVRSSYSVPVFGNVAACRRP
jgi:hypothetical protein